MIKNAIQTGDFGEAGPRPVALVGAGPGSKDLITLRGVQRLQEADIIFYDRLIDPEVLELARRDAARVYVGKAPGAHSWPQDKISGLLVAAAKQGKRVERLKCGDPGIFARGAEEADALNAAGIPYEVVPGVTAASAASAAMGGFLTERGACDTLILTTGRSMHEAETPDWVDLLQEGRRVAVYMGVGTADRIEDALTRAGMSGIIDVDVVADAQRPSQKIVSCKADNLSETLQNNAILCLAPCKMRT